MKIYLPLNPSWSWNVSERGGKICDSYQQLSLQHQPQVGSDWLERRLDVTPWTGRWAQNGEVRKVTNMWSTPACLLSRCVGCVQGRTANNSLCGLAPRLIIDLIFIYIITLVNVIHFYFNPKFDFYLSVRVLFIHGTCSLKLAWEHFSKKRG